MRCQRLIALGLGVAQSERASGIRRQRATGRRGRGLGITPGLEDDVASSVGRFQRDVLLGLHLDVSSGTRATELGIPASVDQHVLRPAQCIDLNVLTGFDNDRLVAATSLAIAGHINASEIAVARLKANMIAGTDFLHMEAVSVGEFESAARDAAHLGQIDIERVANADTQSRLQFGTGSAARLGHDIESCIASILDLAFTAYDAHCIG